MLTTEGKTLVVHVFAGNATEVDGLSCLILNELADDDPSFCKVYNAESDIRTLATKFPSSYHIAVFGCKNFTSVLVDVSEEDGSILVSPRILNPSQTLNIRPSSTFIRIQGISVQ